MTGLRLSRTLGLAVVLGALTVMAGWVWDTPLLRNPFPGTIDMKFNTALGFLLQGIALLLVLRGDGAAWGRPLAKVLALASAAHGGLVVSEYVFAYDSGFSQFFIQEGKDAILTVHLGRPAPITAVTFILLGVSLMQDRLDRWWSRPLPLFAGAASLLGLFGYVYQSPHLYTVVPSATGIAILTVLFFLLLTAGVLTAHPEHPVSAVVLDSGPAGILARTLLPVAILLPLAAEFVTSLGAKWGVYGENNEHVVHALLVAVALVYVCLKTARVLLGVDDLRRRAEKGLLEREKRLRLLLDSVDDGIYGLNREGETTFVNPAAVRALGWTAAEMLGLHLHGMIHHTRVDGSPYPPEECPVHATVGDNTSRSVIGEVFWRKDGTSFPVEYSTTPLTDETGQIGAVVVFRDITERKQAEEKLDQERNFVRRLIDSLPGIFYLIAPDGHFRMWNRNFETVLGHTAGEMARMHALDPICPEDRDKAAQGIVRVFADGYAEIEAGLIGADGRRIDFFLTGQRLQVGEGDMLVGMGIDISARIKVESDLKAAKTEAEEAYRTLRITQNTLVQSEKMASLGGLVAGVAHEINTPVGIALTSASHLEVETGKVARAYAKGELEQADFEEYLSIAAEASRLLVSNCNRAAEMIRSFKQVAVDQTGGERRSFQLREYIDEVLLSLKPRLKRTRLAVAVDCPVDIILDSNPGLLSQSLTNLVMNSIIHAFAKDAEGRITISATLPDPDTVEIRYADDGRGIPPEIRDKIFDPFFTTRRGDGGSGLGLHIVFNAVNSGLKGTITPDYTRDSGAAFVIRIPRVLPPA